MNFCLLSASDIPNIRMSWYYTLSYRPRHLHSSFVDFVKGWSIKMILRQPPVYAPQASFFGYLAYSQQWWIIMKMAVPKQECHCKSDWVEQSFQEAATHTIGQRTWRIAYLAVALESLPVKCTAKWAVWQVFLPSRWWQLGGYTSTFH